MYPFFPTFPTKLYLHLQFLKNLVRNSKFWIILSLDTLLLSISFCAAYAIRFDFHIPPDYLKQCVVTLPFILGVKIPCLFVFGLYRGMWRFTSLVDLVNILIVSLFTSSVLISCLVVGYRFAGFSRSVFIIDCLLTFCLLSWHRLAIRTYYQYVKPGDSAAIPGIPPEKKRLILIGSGDATEKVLREILENSLSPYIPVGLVDDEPQKIGMKLHGVPVIGLVEDLPRQALRADAQEILIATMTSNRGKMHTLINQCRKTQLPVKVLPSMGELLNGQVSVKTIRDISYKDLLGRQEVQLDEDQIGRYLSGKTVLITGAGGSIGSELCRQTLRFQPETIILFDVCEENLYRVQMELRHEHDNVNAVAILGKVQDLRLLNRIFNRHRPEVVFHTAAYKHVPLVERNPWQAVYNNIHATQVLMEASILHGVERFVLVSTDKAVRPTNVMGASKRVTELLMLAYGAAHWDGVLCPAWERLGVEKQPAVPPWPIPQHPGPHSTRFMGVRFGNVLGSSGSVIPLFKRQIEKGGPVTVTDPEVTRYFMSGEEAAQLILQSGSMGNGGEMFLLKMGEPIKIAQMARELIRLSGREPDSEIEIRYVGLRAGEKLYEELISEGENIVETRHQQIMVLLGEQSIPWSSLRDQLEQLAVCARRLDGKGIKQTLHTLVPEYRPDFGIEDAAGG